MGATTNSGRTRNRRAQSLSSIANGQGAQIYPFNAVVDVTGLVTVGLYDEQVEDYTAGALAPGAMIRGIAINGTGKTPFNVPVTLVGFEISFSPGIVLVAADNIQLSAWNEDIRGANGEWMAGAILSLT